MTEASSGEPGREQDPSSRPADSGEPGPAGAAPPWPGTAATPAPGRFAPPPAGSLDGPATQPGSGNGFPQDTNGFGPAQADPWAVPSGGYPLHEQYPPPTAQDGRPPAEQYGYQSSANNPAAAVPRNNRLAIAALVCGLAQFLLGLLIVGNILLAIPAVICGAIGLKQITRRGEGGRGIAIAGLVLGILGVIYFVLIAVVLIIFGSFHIGG